MNKWTLLDVSRPCMQDTEIGEMATILYTTYFLLFFPQAMDVLLALSIYRCYDPYLAPSRGSTHAYM